ncbi:MAG: molybdopterin-dependent oxidoreductase [Chloroflexi bacterium]|nr:molybdopterin-dependent oxidoreductase [Chloroflexota bacterium]
MPNRISRRHLLKLGAGGVAAAAATLLTRDLAYLEPVPEIANPLTLYPNRDWERAYRALNQFDSSFVFLCAPNDTHNCLLRAQVRQGIVTRIEPSYQYGQATDYYGNQASHRWEPRACQKGLATVRKFYGDRRIKGAMVRKGFLAWADAGFPRDPATGKPDPKYLQRGKDEWVKVPWDQAFELAARAIANIATTYTGPDGAARLQQQGYDPDMIASMEGAGVRSMKFRGGMPFLGATRCMGMYRFANMMALLDARLRGVGPDKAIGARGWDNYTWHTDLPPGHPLVTGQQTVDFDLFTAENAKLITLWGMNWISTKMPDGHWLTEARLRGSKVIAISAEYQSSANKADEVLIIRPGTDAALALGCARVIIDERLYDEEFVKSFTDLPLLVRMDTLKLLKGGDLEKDYKPAELKNFARVMPAGAAAEPNAMQGAQQIPELLRNEWSDALVWDRKTNGPKIVTRDQVGKFFSEGGLDPVLEGSFEVALADGKRVAVRPVFDLVREYLKELSPANVAGLTWAPEAGILSLARQIARNPESTLLVHGVGPNHFFNADLKDRAIFLLASLTRNIGYLGGTPGAYAGNYRGALFNGVPAFVQEDPFNIELDPTKPAKLKGYFKAESAHYYNYGDRPLRVGNKQFTGKSHMPSPTKLFWAMNSNSILGNAKGAYDVVVNTLPKIEAIFISDWWWTMSCEYADIVFGVDSWGEVKYPDMAGSVSNPFVTVYPRTPLPRIFDTRADIEVEAGVARALAKITGDQRFADHWAFVEGNRVDVYLQRIVDNSSTLRGYRFNEMEVKARQGIPVLKNVRTYPRVMGWEHTQESRPWYTKTGRLEFYRDEDEFIEYGENLPVYREPIDATVHEPNVIVAASHPAIRPAAPETYGLKRDDLATEVRQVRNVVKTWAELKTTDHPLKRDGFTHLFITPKYRHGAHTTPVDIDMSALFFGPFGDPFRRDKRMPYVNEGYVDINPKDARELGIEDGDYVWIDADPSDRPYRGAKPTDADYKVMRLICRARYYNGIPRRVLRMWFNMYQASHGTALAHQQRPDGLAKNPNTNYQAMFRSGGHQSATRAWLRPTLLTESIVRKAYYGQTIGKGFESDVYCANGAPKEAYVKIAKAENGGLENKGLWRGAQLGLRPTYEHEAMKRYLAGGYVEVK